MPETAFTFEKIAHYDAYGTPKRRGETDRTPGGFVRTDTTVLEVVTPSGRDFDTQCPPGEAQEVDVR